MDVYSVFREMFARVGVQDFPWKTIGNFSINMVGHKFFVLGVRFLQMRVVQSFDSEMLLGLIVRGVHCMVFVEFFVSCFFRILSLFYSMRINASSFMSTFANCKGLCVSCNVAVVLILNFKFSSFCILFLFVFFSISMFLLRLLGFYQANRKFLLPCPMSDVYFYDVRLDVIFAFDMYSLMGADFKSG